MVLKKYFVELSGIPSCAHGDTIEEAIEEAIEKRDGIKPITDEERKKYSASDFKFNVRIFRRLTKACKTGVNEWLRHKNLDPSVMMTIDEIREVVPSQWVDRLESALK